MKKVHRKAHAFWNFKLNRTRRLNKNRRTISMRFKRTIERLKKYSRRRRILGRL